MKRRIVGLVMLAFVIPNAAKGDLINNVEYYARIVTSADVFGVGGYSSSVGGQRHRLAMNTSLQQSSILTKASGLAKS